jgi:NAD(P)-dependent dehydrogenase (short-subunit alcohol dehydrogenase family)
MEEFRGRVAVVTGAASGIGLALSKRFAAEGMKVVMSDIETNVLEQAKSDLAKSGAEVVAVRCDVSVADDVSALAEATLDAFGKVHVVCNNAGVFAGGALWEAPLSDFEWTFGVNVYGVIHGIRTFVPILLRQGEPGHIVNSASMAAVTRGPFAGAYYMSKHAVLALSETLYYELRAQEAPVGVSALCPELIDTGIGRADRNRPAHLKRAEGENEGIGTIAEAAIKEMTAAGLNPMVMADRVVQAIRDEQLYILSEEGGNWRNACNDRLDDLRLARNPGELTVLGTNR